MDYPGKLQALFPSIEETSKNSDIDDDEEPLSHAEESAIEECLNDTEGSLSSVDLNIFDDISDDIHVHKTKKTRGLRTSERVNKDIGGNGKDYDSPLDEAASRELQILKEEIRKIRSTMSNSSTKNPDLPSLKTNRKIVRRKRRNSPPIRKNDKRHIYSFFSAMADLVSTFPKDHVTKAKQNVNSIMEEMVDKLKEWFYHEDSKNSTHDFGNLFDYTIIQDKLARLQDMN